jgi:putative ABC transport system permease protein
MHVKDGLLSAFQSISSHKLRSLLTLTGIVIGVLAVVAMFSSIYALKDLVKSNMEGMGWDYSLIIVPETSSIRNSFRGTFRRTRQNVESISYEDYEALRDELEYKTIYGNIESNSLYRLKNKTQFVRLRATNRSFFTTKSYTLSAGRLFNPYEEENRIPVAVLGSYFAQDYFGDKDPIGKSVKLGDTRFTVVGVLSKDKLNQGSGMNFNNWERKEDLKAVYVPLSYGAKYLGTGGGVHMIYLQAKSKKDIDNLKQQARQLLLSRHNMYPNFGFLNIGQMMLQINEEIDKNMKKWNIALSAIASISLIVGGIGLFSTLLISIQERMMEIGIRKSIGATEADIFFYFIFEALSLAFLGALLGVMLAGLLISGIEHAIKIPLYLPIQGVALGFGFSLLIGFLSGIYPAAKAARIDPIQAIYYS